MRLDANILVWRFDKFLPIFLKVFGSNFFSIEKCTICIFARSILRA